MNSTAKKKPIAATMDVILAETLERAMDDEDIRNELARLFHLQLEALDLATFSLAGMTPTGWREYAERQARIRSLKDQLGLLGRGRQRRLSETPLRKRGSYTHLQ
jgi:hypothetical protein